MTIKLVATIAILVVCNSLSVEAKEIVNYTESVKEDTVDECIETIELLPDNLIERAEQDGYEINLFGVEDDGAKVTLKFPGYTYCKLDYSSTGEATEIKSIDCYSNILVKQDKDDSNSKYNSILLLHEFGHYVDRISIENSDKRQTVSRSYEWFKLYNKYKDEIAQYDEIASLNVYNSSECFAHCFAICIYDSELVKSNCVDVYNFITNTCKLIGSR